MLGILFSTTISFFPYLLTIRSNKASPCYPNFKSPWKIIFKHSCLFLNTPYSTRKGFGKSDFFCILDVVQKTWHYEQDLHSINDFLSIYYLLDILLGAQIHHQKTRFQGNLDTRKFLVKGIIYRIENPVKYTKVDKFLTINTIKGTQTWNLFES